MNDNTSSNLNNNINFSNDYNGYNSYNTINNLKILIKNLYKKFALYVRPTGPGPGSPASPTYGTRLSLSSPEQCCQIRNSSVRLLSRSVFSGWRLWSVFLIAFVLVSCVDGKHDNSMSSTPPIDPHSRSLKSFNEDVTRELHHQKRHKHKQRNYHHSLAEVSEELNHLQEQEERYITEQYQRDYNPYRENPSQYQDNIFKYPDVQQDQEDDNYYRNSHEFMDLYRQQSELHEQIQRLHEKHSENMDGFLCPNCLENPYTETEESKDSPKLSVEYSRSSHKPKIQVAADAAHEANTGTDAKPNKLNTSDQLRLEAIKHQILLKLGLKSKPNITNELPREFILDTLKRVNNLNLDQYGMVHSYHAHPATSYNNGIHISFANDKYYMHQHSQQHHTLQQQQEQQQQQQQQQVSPSIYSNSSYVLNQINSDSSLYINDHSNLSSYDMNQQEPPYNSQLQHHNQNHNHDNDQQQHPQYHQQRYQYNNYNKDSSRGNNSSDTNYRYRSSNRETTDDSVMYDDESEYDDFYGRTREIISFAERGQLLNGQHLLEFSSTTTENRTNNIELNVRVATLWVWVDYKRDFNNINSKHNKLDKQNKLHSKNKRNNKSNNILKTNKKTKINNINNENNNLKFNKTNTNSNNRKKKKRKRKNNENNSNHIINTVNNNIYNNYNNKQNNNNNNNIYNNDDNNSNTPKATKTTTVTSKTSTSSSKHDKSLTLWVFRLLKPYKYYNSSILVDKDFDKLTEMSASKQINLNQLGWQKFDLSSTIRKWYAENSGERLRLFIDCSGCGDRIQVHLFTNNNYKSTNNNNKNKQNNNFLSKSNNQKYRNTIHDKSGKEGTTTTAKEELNQHEPDKGSAFDVNRPFLVIFTDPNVMKRVRRRALDCSGAIKTQCCKEKFYVSFKQLGWDDWIIAPQGYYANYCRGDCGGLHRTPDTFLTYYTHVIEEYRKSEKLNGMQPCCAPLKFSSMSLIYFGPDSKIIKRDLPKMVVDECGCP